MLKDTATPDLFDEDEVDFEQEHINETLREMGGGDGLFECDSCDRCYGHGQYSPDCPHGGYDPSERIKQGMNSPEKVFCQSYKVDRHWYFDRNTPQEVRDKLPLELRPWQ